MNFDPFFRWVEESSLSVWIVESPSMFAFPGILVFHALGMAFLVGGNVALDLRVLGFARGIPIPSMERFFPVMWFGFLVNTISGILLLIGYPTKALTNPVFYLKLTLILLAMVTMRWLQVRILHNPGPEKDSVSSRARLLAVVSILMWFGAVTSGRLLAYTANRLTVDMLNF
jgi:hypothetical protein